MCTDIVVLERQDGTRIENIKASVQPEMIFIPDGKLPIEPGDLILRALPSGVVERLTITEPGFYAQQLGMSAHYQARYERNARATVRAPARPLGFDSLLHPLILDAAGHHFHAGDFRNAVLDAITAVFDKIRERTSVDLDGDKLINQVLSVDNPLLILSEIQTQSGRNDQSGFADIFRGLYRGVRNPKAHSLNHDLNELKAGQYLVLASLLMRRVVEATEP